jgi:hypothetical protein
MVVRYLVSNVLVVGILWYPEAENERRDLSLGTERFGGINEGEWFAMMIRAGGSRLQNLISRSFFWSHVALLGQQGSKGVSVDWKIRHHYFYESSLV